MLRSLQAFTGPVTGINPRDPDPAGGRFSSVAAAAEATGAPLDLAVLCVPASASAPGAHRGGRGGARAALVCSGGYAEAGIAGAAFQRDLAAAAARGRRGPARAEYLWLPGTGPAAARLVRARRRERPGRAGRGRRGQRRGQPRPGVPARRGRAGCLARGRAGQRGGRVRRRRAALPGRRSSRPAPWPCTWSRSPTARRWCRGPVPDGPQAGGRAGRRPARRRPTSPRRTPARWPPRGAPPAPRSRQAGRGAGGRRARTGRRGGRAVGHPAAAAPRDHGSGWSPRRPARGCCTLDELRGRGIRVPPN